jgi:hypothetical protein
VVEVVSSDGESVAITAEDEHVKIRAGKRNSGSEWERSTVNEMNTVGIHKIGETRRASYSSDADNFLVRNTEFLDDIEKKRQAPRNRRKPGTTWVYLLLIASL